MRTKTQATFTLSLSTTKLINDHSETTFIPKSRIVEQAILKHLGEALNQPVTQDWLHPTCIKNEHSDAKRCFFNTDGKCGNPNSPCCGRPVELKFYCSLWEEGQ